MMRKRMCWFTAVIVMSMSILFLSACSKKELCSVDGCDHEVYQDGLCADHYVAKAVEASLSDSGDSEEASETIADEPAELPSEAEDSSGLEAEEYPEIADGEVLTVDDRGEFYIDFSEITARVTPPAPASFIPIIMQEMESFMSICVWHTKILGLLTGLHLT